MFGYIQNWISKNGNVGTLMHFDEHIVQNILLPIKIDSFEIFFDMIVGFHLSKFKLLPKISKNFQLFVDAKTTNQKSKIDAIG